MIVRTKKTQLLPQTYVSICSSYALHRHTWPLILSGIVGIGILFLRRYWIAGLIFLGLIAYFFLIRTMFRYTARIPENQRLFEPVHYEITAKALTICFSAKERMEVPWKEIKYVEKRQYRDTALFLSNVHALYVSYMSFKTSYDRRYFDIMLKRNKLL